MLFSTLPTLSFSFGIKEAWQKLAQDGMRKMEFVGFEEVWRGAPPGYAPKRQNEPTKRFGINKSVQKRTQNEPKRTQARIERNRPTSLESVELRGMVRKQTQNESKTNPPPEWANSQPGKHLEVFTGVRATEKSANWNRRPRTARSTGGRTPLAAPSANCLHHSHSPWNLQGILANRGYKCQLPAI
jgi:hypothetical protein